MPQPHSPASPKATVYYDGACPLCRAECDLYRRTQGAEALDFVDVSDGASALPLGLSRADALARFHVSTPGGTVVSGAEAFTEVWSHLPRWRWLARAARLTIALHLMELAYRVFLRLRPAIVWVFVRLRGTP